jgi:hypothetical protein
MIVEPVPTSPRSPVRRGLRLLSVAVPPVLLAAFITAGALGPRDEPPALATASPPAVADAVPRTTTAPMTPFLEPALAGLTFEHPPQVAGLPVRSVAETLAEHRTASIDRFVAIAGYLSIPGLPPECADGHLGPFDGTCELRTILADSPAVESSPSTPGVSVRGMGSHLHPRMLPGVRLPYDVADTPSGDGEPVPVIVIGRFTDADRDTCASEGRHCGEAFAVERIAWVNGDDYPRMTMLDPALDVDWGDATWRSRRDHARSALGERRIPLAIAFATPELLRRLDPQAAALAGEVLERRGTAATSAVWYVRGLDFDAGTVRVAPPRLAWVVVDDAGTVLAAGDERAPATLPSP